MVRNLKQALLNWLLAYWAATVILILFTIALGLLLHLPSARELGVPVGSSPAWLASFPYQPPVNLAVFVWFAWRYLRSCSAADRFREAGRLVLRWGVISAASDFLFWVIIPSPMQLTIHDFYFVYGPTVLTIYLCILSAPMLAALLLRRRPA